MRPNLSLKSARLTNNIGVRRFNKAHAQVKLGDLSGAQESLRRTLQIDPTVTAARHMLRALDADEALRAQSAEEDYVRDLFDSYADSYDSHGKKLLYSAPRIIRQELAAIYKSVFADKFDAAAAASGPEQSFPAASEPVGSSCSSYSSFMNNSLDILDIGCGTGQAGAWLKDYAKSLVGVGTVVHHDLPCPALPLPCVHDQTCRSRW